MTISLKKLISYVFILSFSVLSKAQVKQYDAGNLTFEKYVSEKYCKIVTDLENLPPKVSKLINTQLKKQTGSHFENFTFKSCEIIEVKKFLQDYPDSLNYFFLPIPRYRIVLSWCDSIIGVKSYLFPVLVDEYDQFIYLGFPRVNQYIEDEFENLMSFDKACLKVDSIITSDTVKYEDHNAYLYYDIHENDLKWMFTYSKDKYRKEGDKTFSLFRELIFSLKKRRLLRDVTEENEFIYFQF